MVAPSIPRTETAAAPRRPRVGIVLGAGGIRGCAHAGAIQVLHDASIPIDVVIGASVGSMFGLGLAAGLPIEYISRVARDARPVDMVRFYSGRLRGGTKNPIARMIHDAGAGKEFRDLPVPFAVTVTDIERGSPMLVQSGPVVRAVEASIAVPYFASPVTIEGRVCADGGLMDTLPVWAAREMGADVTIGVCLGFNYIAPAFFRRHSWAQRAIERVGHQRGPVTTNFRDQVRFSCRLCTVSLEPRLPSDAADVTIWPHLGGLSPNSPFGARFCYEQGMRAAEAALPQIEEMLRNRLPSVREMPT